SLQSDTRAGDKGPKGKPGKPGLINFCRIYTVTRQNTDKVSCDNSDKAVGGGGSCSDGIEESYPSSDSEWTVECAKKASKSKGYNSYGGSDNSYGASTPSSVYVVCVSDDEYGCHPMSTSYDNKKSY